MKDTSADALWTFAINLYQHKALAEHCLKLQDEYRVNINILLWCIWCGEEGMPIDEARLDLAALEIHAWHGQMVEPLRTIRRAMKNFDAAQKNKSLASCYEQMKAAELALERVELSMLAQLCEEWSEPNATESLNNLSLYLKKMHVKEEYVQKMLELAAKTRKKLPH